MKSDMLLSVITAVAIHAFIFCVPLLKTKNNKTRAHIYEPIPISIISPQETVAATPPAKASVKASIKPPSAGRRHVSGRKKAASHQTFQYGRTISPIVADGRARAMAADNCP